MTCNILQGDALELLRTLPRWCMGGGCCIIRQSGHHTQNVRGVARILLRRWLGEAS